MKAKSFLEVHKDEIISKLPNLRDDLNSFRERINKATCPDCVKRSLERRIKRKIGERMTLGMFSPELEKILLPYSKVVQQQQQLSTRKAPSLEANRTPAPDQKAPSEMTINDERQGCIDCVRKHLSQAMILLRECNQGYGTDDFEHKWLAVGHLAEAADEALHVDPDLSMKIRDIRLSIMEQGY